MLLDLQLDASPDRSAQRARELVEAGAAGLFTFEGPHDVFLPLAVAAGAVEADLMTNVAIAMPRSPMHLAHAAWDLQLMSRGRFRLGLGSQVRPHIENRYGATWSPPAARMREIVLAVKAILASWQDGSRLDFRGEHTRHTLMPPTFVPGPNPYGAPPVLLGALGPVMTRTAAEVADGLLVMPFHSHRHFRERTLPAVAEGLARAGRTRVDLFPQAILAMGDDRGVQGRRGGGRPHPARVLRLDSGLPPGARRRGLGRPAARAQRPVQARRRRGRWRPGDRRPGRHPGRRRHPAGVRGGAAPAGSGTWPTGSAPTSRATTPGSRPSPRWRGALA